MATTLFAGRWLRTSCVQGECNVMQFKPTVSATDWSQAASISTFKSARSFVEPTYTCFGGMLGIVTTRALSWVRLVIALRHSDGVESTCRCWNLDFRSPRLNRSVDGRTVGRDAVHLGVLCLGSIVRVNSRGMETRANAPMFIHHQIYQSWSVDYS